MSFRAPVLLLRDILRGIERIEQHMAGMDFDSFQRDSKTVDAVERNLQRISEAAVRLGDQAEVLCPGLPWREIRGIGNWLRHQYDRVDLETIWHTATVDMTPLKVSVEAALERLRGPSLPFE